MHTFRPSRGRVLFEVLCALAIAASFAGGWFQTGAWALLPAAVIAALYSLVRAFDLAERGSAFVAAHDAMELKADDPSASDEQPESVNAIERMELVGSDAPPAKKARKTRAPRKARTRSKATEDREVAEPVPPPEHAVSLADALDEEGLTLAEDRENVAHFPLTPLFEPEPFVRQQRAVFGRKAG